MCSFCTNTELITHNASQAAVFIQYLSKHQLSLSDVKAVCESDRRSRKVHAVDVILALVYGESDQDAKFESHIPSRSDHVQH
ncbi:hypothetical protein Plhal703r1_c33g0125921 [Plasmopara halstedii]